MAAATRNADRRVLHFEDGAGVLSDARRVAEAEIGGRLRRSGNWTAGQAFGHLATWINFAYDGYPPELRPAWVIRAVCRVLKPVLLRRKMKPGIRIPGVKGGTLGTEPKSTREGLAALERAWERLEGSAPTAPNALFGPLTHREWIQMNLRHAELHLGFMHPGATGAGAVFGGTSEEARRAARR